jgi:hypothetical protein
VANDGLALQWGSPRLQADVSMARALAVGLDEGRHLSFCTASCCHS